MDDLVIGSIVHYVAFGTQGSKAKPQHRPAIVVEIKDDGSCILMIMNPTGIYFSIAPHSEKAKPGTWHWIEK